MYVDDHEGKDVVKYWKEFVECWKEYEKHFVIYDYNGNIFQHLPDFLSHKVYGFGWFC